MGSSKRSAGLALTVPSAELKRCVRRAEQQLENHMPEILENVSSVILNNGHSKRQSARKAEPSAETIEKLLEGQANSLLELELDKI